MNETSSFDAAAIQRLCRLGGDKFAAEMIGLFGTYGGKKLTEARQAQQAGNLPALADAAHPIKSSAGNVGAVRVQELAAQLEATARENNAGLVGRQLDELEQAFAAVKTLLMAEQARLEKPPG